MKADFDVIVLGFGAMGSAATWQLASRGARVLGLDQFAPPHARGSSHGQTRIIREAYFEDPAYVPLVQRAYDLWDQLEKSSGTRLFEQAGGLMVGRPESIVFSGAQRSAIQHGLKHEILTAQEVSKRYPGLQPASDMMAVWEPRAGFLYPERCIQALLDQAIHLGAQVRQNQPVTGWAVDGAGVVITTPDGALRARKLIVSAGAWLPKLFPDLKSLFRVERQVLYWFQALATHHAHFQHGSFPVHLWQYGPHDFFYGFPDIGGGVKVAKHHSGPDADPDAVDRQVSPQEIQEMRDVLERFLPGANGPLIEATVCLYTNTRDGHFLIDQHPAHPEIVIASPCSGHGFKFASAIGEVLSELALDGTTPRLPELFRFARLG